MYGDLIIWKQIIVKAKDDNIDTVIFITDDVKEDWWYILDSNGKKEIGVRAELREEIYRESNISSFEVLRTTDFMKSGKEFLELDVDEKSIAEAKSNIEEKQTTLLKDIRDRRHKRATSSYAQLIENLQISGSLKKLEDSSLKYENTLSEESKSYYEAMRIAEAIAKIKPKEFIGDYESEIERIMNNNEFKCIDIENESYDKLLINQNSPCICGSGKPFRFCCGMK